ncbi:PID-CTERM protein-sorting domain-containing protein [Hymenobacter jeollabukensis]|uniref:VPDSG-CTERM sorting domain-containing protein n=1 Tax=Hymenobacter jeollabukensis TaxID=2025313 RepID=A0A5R8WJG9_9BACT|nr:hypothetical protein [Hymenobacter jeollabukensis]TLM88919.1 hypothetical protein FDY95_22310 [Hymenobacter jeollabukensis]
MLRSVFRLFVAPGFAGALLLLSTAPLQAQDPGSGGPTPGTQEPTAVPIDAGASLLLASGAAYALRTLRRRTTQQAAHGRRP